MYPKGSRAPNRDFLTGWRTVLFQVTIMAAKIPYWRLLQDPRWQKND